MAKLDEIGRALELLRRAGAELSLSRPGDAKLPRVKQALAEACGGVAAGSRLPSIRMIAEALHTSVVTAQRAVDALKREGHIRVQHKSGLFVRGEGEARPSSPSAMANFKRQIRFLTDSVLPRQRVFWDGVVKDFQNGQDYISVHLDYWEPPETTLPALLPDAFECVEWNYYRKLHQLGPLRLKGYLADTPAQLVGDSLATIYYQSAFLFYNAAALARLGLPVPRPRGFAEQLEYLRQLKAFHPTPSVVFPFLLGGRLVADLAAAIRQGRDLEGAGLPARFLRLMELTAKLSYATDNESLQCDERFAAGELPIFLGGSIFLREFREKGLPFEWGAWPALNVDDGPVKIPVAAAALERTNSPMECVRWIKHLLSPAIQGKFADFGYLAGPLSTLGKFNCPEEGVKLLEERFASSAPLFAPTHAEHYVGVCIVNAEIWDCVVGKQDAAAAWRNVVTYAKAYLSA